VSDQIECGDADLVTVVAVTHDELLDETVERSVPRR
jgi:hypothetical protein